MHRIVWSLIAFVSFSSIALFGREIKISVVQSTVKRNYAGEGIVTAILTLLLYDRPFGGLKGTKKLSYDSRRQKIQR